MKHLEPLATSRLEDYRREAAAQCALLNHDALSLPRAARPARLSLSSLRNLVVTILTWLPRSPTPQRW